MIRYTTGDLFSSSAQVLVYPVSCRTAREGTEPGIRREDMEAYLKAAKRGEERLLFCDISRGGKNHTVCLFPVKDESDSSLKLSGIEEGLEDLVRRIIGRQIQSAALPRIGCKGDGPEWDKIKPIMEKELLKLKSCDVEIYV